MSDLVTRLRDVCLFSKTDWQDDVALAREAADEIERVARLARSLIDNEPDDMAGDGVTVLDVWRKEARRVLNAAWGEAS